MVKYTTFLKFGCLVSMPISMNLGDRLMENYATLKAYVTRDRGSKIPQI